MLDTINLVLVINELRDVIHENAVKKGFYDAPINFGERMALIHSEVSEALEAHRCSSNTDELTDQVKSELADIIIRVLDVCGYYKVNIADAILSKHQTNIGRPRKHGKNY